MKPALLSFAIWFSAAAVAAPDCNRDLLRGRLREQYAVVNKVSKVIAFAEITVLGKPSQIMIRDESLGIKQNKTWADVGVRVGTPLLITWIPWKLSAVSYSTASFGSAPAKIVDIDADSIFLEALSDGENIFLVAGFSAIYDYQGQPLDALNLRKGSAVWVKWNPETGDVESVVP
jgi:hypothetical protein